MKRIMLVSLCALTFGFGSLVRVQAGCGECWSCFCATVSPYLKIAGETLTKEFVEAVSAGLKNLQANKAQVFQDVLLLVTGNTSALTDDAMNAAKAALKTLNMVNDDGSIKSNAKDIVTALVTTTATTASTVASSTATTRSIEHKEPVATRIKVLSVKEAITRGTVKHIDE